MEKKLIVGLAILSLALAAYAGEPWKDKPYQQWDAKDVHQIMFNSPWAQVVQVEAKWKKSGSGYTQPLSRGGSDQAIGTTASGASAGVGMAGGTAGEGELANQTNQPTASFLIRWASSRVEREAAVRNAILSGVIKEPEAEKYLSGAMEGYQLLVAGPDMTPFEEMQEKTLQENTYLQPKNSKQKIAPIKIQIGRDAKSQKVSAVLFVFPKKLASGEPTVTADEKNVDFVCTVGETTLKASFEIRRMADKQGQDL